MARRNILLVVENETVPNDTRVMWQARTLAALGHDVRIIAPTRPGLARKEHIDGVEVRRVRFPDEPRIGRHLVEYALGILRIGLAVEMANRRRPVDVIVTASPPDLLTLTGGLRRLRGCRLVFDHHDLSPELWIAQGGQAGGRVHRALLVAERYAVRMSDHVVSVNETYRDLLVSRTDAALEDVTVVMNGVGPAFHEGDHRLPVEAWPWETTVGYVASMAPQAGVEGAVQALKVAVDRGLDIGLVLAGDGPSAANAAALADSLGLAGRVEFLGRVPYEEVSGLLRSVDVGISPDAINPFTDASTMVKTLEYVAAGLPIVSNDLRETRRVCGEAAVYSERPDRLGDTLVALVQNPEQMAACAAAARDRAPGLGREQWIEPMLAALDLSPVVG